MFFTAFSTLSIAPNKKSKIASKLGFFQESENCRHLSLKAYKKYRKAIHCRRLRVGTLNCRFEKAPVFEEKKVQEVFFSSPFLKL